METVLSTSFSRAGIVPSENRRMPRPDDDRSDLPGELGVAEVRVFTSTADVRCQARYGRVGLGVVVDRVVIHGSRSFGAFCVAFLFGGAHHRGANTRMARLPRFAIIGGPAGMAIGSQVVRPAAGGHRVDTLQGATRTRAS